MTKQFKAKSINVDSFEQLQASLGAFRHLMNKCVAPEDYQTIINRRTIAEFELNALAKSYSAKPQVPETSLEFLVAYDMLLRSQLSDPEKWGLLPTIDSINFTASATKSEVAAITQFFERADISDYNLVAVKDLGNHNQYSEEKKIRNYYRSTYRIRLLQPNETKSEPLYFSFGTWKRKGKKQKALRFSFNPARFSNEQIKDIFKALDQTGIFKNLLKTLTAATVTRIDLALDFVGIPAAMIPLATSNVQRYNAVPKEPEDGLGQTFYVGSKSKSRTVIYNKIAKQLGKRQNHVITLSGPDLNPFELVRLEVVSIPQGNNGKKIKLPELETLSSMFRAKAVYSPLLYLEYPQLTEQFLELGVIKTLRNYSKKLDKSGNLLTAKMLKQLTVKNKSMRQKQLKAMFKLIEKYKMHINLTWFNAKQKDAIKKLIFNITAFSRG